MEQDAEKARRDAGAIAQQIIDGDIAPYRGAARIWALFAELGDPYPEDVVPFVGLASEWQDQPEHREAYEADIRDEARRFCAKPS
jgi:hypothetical protein